MLNQLEVVTLQAFLTALAQLDTQLPTQLQQDINEVGKMLLNQSQDAINRLLKLAEDDCIKSLYWQARVDIQTQYETQELNKYDNPSQQNQSTTAPPERIANIAIPILTATDSSSAAKKHKSEIIPG
ncbi:hypothetical protein I8751_14305 [Nostocaceae cyanobacterium CENA357]|uniref:Uncharacterized protein n=1 Tax=Atlanticothrix silvestris CENA357 TaxID=1725252 RepID=A0A8J7HJ50_9CYAN|nr:hypothetical protein [Atlanticothrix silvestris]MBH8553521.1 hypothetical protein [Atlanticothrix silvestris CENA357]